MYYIIMEIRDVNHKITWKYWRASFEVSKRNRTHKEFLRQGSFKNYLEDLEDIYLSDKVVDRIRKGEEDVISSEEMGKILGLDN